MYKLMYISTFITNTFTENYNCFKFGATMERIDIDAVSDIEKFKHYALAYVRNKEAKCSSYRCPNCWHEKVRCLCNSLPQVCFSDRVKLIIYMDYKEIYNAGDDAKLISCACPDQSIRAVYPIEDDKLLKYIQSIGGEENAIVLFPGPSSVSLDEYLIRIPNIKSKNTLGIIVVDGVWRHARRMASHLKDILPNVIHVQLTPEQMSIYARKQTQLDRISTVEATALFLSNFGEDNLMCDNLVECVRMNNEALKGKVICGNKMEIYYSKSSRNPAWYYGYKYYGML